MSSSADPTGASDRPRRRCLRADAERNRDRILAAARRLYARDGLGVSMAAVAREAGVGKATLCRRFATREELVDAVFADRMDAYAAAVTAALADPDPWRGFVGCVQAVCAMQAADRGFADVLTTAFPAAGALEERRSRAHAGLVELIDRAKASGHLRDDVTDRDVVILLMANAGVLDAAGEAAPDAWRRLVAQMLRAYAAPGAALPPLPDPPSPAALSRAVLLGRTGQAAS
ncbi:TetR/AcrR family transcriptional regulator [Thermobifida cellulosilytica]|uniref:TetR family transcriptional regulator n=1 Tax=Thermobifida cellulosilytica TB100 TaxID=665004 RepID=A0A147KHV9_THECS|nr:TetR/AcrR family transcriptional regulator [Thermobifida cellulosilytica]KUP96892.1 TetR family transcriptional regulator [Thermobifida cellulosilytica TB100]